MAKRNLSDDFYFSGALPISKNKLPETKVLVDNFTEAETNKILEMCRKGKITLNTFIITIANFALLTVAQTKSKILIGRRKILRVTAIDLRRYFEPQHKEAPGHHASVMEEEINVSLSDAEDFWMIAHKDHSNFLKGINIKKEHIKILPLIHFVNTVRKLNIFLSSKGYKGCAMLHYGSSNMGNLDKLLPESKEEDDAEITYMVTSHSAHHNGILFGLSYHTLKHKLILSMDYSTYLTTEETAQDFYDCLYKFIRNIINQNRLIIE